MRVALPSRENGVLRVMKALRHEAPGVAETVEWAEAATILNEQGVPWPRAFARAIGVVLKDQDDLTYVAPRIDALIMGSAA